MRILCKDYVIDCEICEGCSWKTLKHVCPYKLKKCTKDIKWCLCKANQCKYIDRIKDITCVHYDDNCLVCRNCKDQAINTTSICEHRVCYDCDYDDDGLCDNHVSYVEAWDEED